MSVPMKAFQSSKGLLNKSNMNFTKLMTNHRKTHIIDILNTYDTEHYQFGRNIPLDFYIKKYFLKHKYIKVQDREFIYEEVYNLMSITNITY